MSFKKVIILKRGLLLFSITIFLISCQMQFHNPFFENEIEDNNNRRSVFKEGFESGLWTKHESVPGTATESIIAGNNSPSAMQIVYIGAGVGNVWVFYEEQNCSNWSRYNKLKLDTVSLAVSNNEFRIILTEEGTSPNSQGEMWEYTITPTDSWQTYEIDFSSFTKRADWQPPDQDNDGLFELHSIYQIDIMNYNWTNSDTLTIDNMSIIK